MRKLLLLPAASVALCALWALPAAAHSGDVTTSQDCHTWSASVTLAHNVTVDRTVDVVSTIPGTSGISGGHYDESVGQIWSETGTAPASGTVTLNIYNGQSLEFTTSASLPPAGECATTTTTVPPTTTTTVPPTTTSTSTSTSTSVPKTTTTMVHLIPPINTVPPSTTTTSIPSLPFTGSASGTFAWIALACTIIGGALLLVRRRGIHV